MAKINLLPWREERREELKQAFIKNIVATVLAAVGLLVGAYMVIGGSIQNQAQRNNYLQTNITSLNEQVKEIAELKSKRAKLEERMDIIQGLQGNRPVIVRVFDQFVRTLPEGLYYTELSRLGDVVTIGGTAESNNRVSSLMRSLDNSDWFTNPNLTSVKANPDFGEQANNFKLSVSLSSPEAEEEEK